MVGISDLSVKIFADGADLEGMLALYANPLIKGFTTNPTLMRAAGVADYVAVTHRVLSAIKDKPVSWASPREVLNIIQADEVGCHIITATHDILKKLALLGKDDAEYSLETVEMFHGDALLAGYTIPISGRSIAA